jgi:cellulose synthase/poly-beta-1,6-N-acetylglucosamine synthase-like glycosyltransferase
MIKYKELVNGVELFGAIYSVIYLLVYIILGILAFLSLRDYHRSRYFLRKKILTKSNNAIGVSIVAPAYNEEVTIVSNVKSLLSQEYPKFEVVITNDGSTDSTLDILIEEFSLIQVHFHYQEKIKTKPVKAHYKSTNPLYAKLLVVDKENGGCKADGSNAGINSAKYPLFICTDVDCILRRDTITTLAKPFIENTVKVIATGAMIRISNACEFKDGMLHKSHFPFNFFARFQELEYIRSYLYGRMAWSKINGLLLVSGGLGMFDKEIAIEAGGYWDKSLGEDFDLILRMRKRMHEEGEAYLIKYVPESLCWTEVPSTMKVFFRQRTRWARGLIQTLYIHRNVMFNKKYGTTGLISYPYFLFFEFAVPIIEVIGLLVLLSKIIANQINNEALLLVTLTIYLFYISITLLSVIADQIFFKHYSNFKEILALILTVFLEPILYHPLNIIAYINGYFNFLINKKKKWGVMTRKGFNNPATE